MLVLLTNRMQYKVNGRWWIWRHDLVRVKHKSSPVESDFAHPCLFRSWSRSPQSPAVSVNVLCRNLVQNRESAFWLDRMKTCPLPNYTNTFRRFWSGSYYITVQCTQYISNAWWYPWARERAWSAWAGYANIWIVVCSARARAVPRARRSSGRLGSVGSPSFDVATGCCRRCLGLYSPTAPTMYSFHDPGCCTLAPYME